MTVRTPIETARLALACLDLTSLNETDREADVARLCERAVTPHGRVAAVCVWPWHARAACAHAPAGVAVAAVANFPEGSIDVERAVRDTRTIVDAGAQEVDLVLPWRALAAGDADDEAACVAVLRAVRRAGTGLRLKVILESGELGTAALIERASTIALAEGADFLKTSTGKTRHGATPQAARTMLEVIARSGTAAGFKASGGVRTVADAAVYLDLVEAVLGRDALVPQRCRIGASTLLGDIEATLAGTGAGPAAPGY